jgi:hypothetical protein
MAEIKSTMEMVMERAARMEAEGGGADLLGEDKAKKGMRAGAAYMRDGSTDLLAALNESPVADRKFFIKGVAEALLRNISLPREDEQLESAGQAMNGLVQVGQGHKDLLALFGDLSKIMDQYLQHRRQLREQLEANFAQMMPQLEAAMAQKTGQHMKLKPSQHPKYQEEWQKALDELNSQYGQAVDQHKQMAIKILTGMV